MKQKILKTKNEFVEFLKNYNVFQLAIGVVVGTAAKELVTSIVNDLVMPILGVLEPSGNWKNWAWQVGGVSLKVGNFAASLIDFLIIALIVFVVVKKVLKIDVGGKQ